MKRNAIIIAMAMLIALTGCSTKNTKETSAPPTKEQTTSLQMTEEETTQAPTKALTDYEKMLETSLLGMGNNYRIQNVMKRLENGEDIGVGFIGGSITEGYNGKTKDIFAKLVTDELGKRGSGNVTLTNAGISGTPSMLGLIRSDRDLFQTQQDIIFIEFAVNDATSNVDKAAYESLVKKALEQENKPAVILLISVTKDGYSCQDQMNLIAFTYKVPIVSYRNAIMKEIEEGRLEWKDISADESHPNEYGHRLYADFILHMIDRSLSNELDEEFNHKDKMLNGADYSEMIMLDKTNLSEVTLGSFEEKSGHALFPDGWVKTEGESDNASFQFEMEGDALFFVFKTTKKESYGTAEIYIDGVKESSLVACTKDGWENPTTQFVYKNREGGKHTVEIKMAEGDEQKAFALLAIGMVP